jgi:hypothetical protein
MNEKQLFLDHLKQQGFELSPVLQIFHREPSCLMDGGRNKHIVSNIHVSLFDGCDTKEGGLGCVVFSFKSKTKNYRCKTTHTDELFKRTLLPETASDAIKAFEIWKEACLYNFSKWKELV